MVSNFVLWWFSGFLVGVGLTGWFYQKVISKGGPDV